jgi:ketosteroid isomerase-like protein
MSQENVERIQRSLDAFTRRDEVAWQELCDPDSGLHVRKRQDDPGRLVHRS